MTEDQDDTGSSFPSWVQSCSCGREGRYQNMVCGDWVWTCGKRGCYNQSQVTSSSHTIATTEE